MNLIPYKTFLLSKDGSPGGRQDSLGTAPCRGLFAVADGVSNSYRPDFVSKAICDWFTTALDNPDPYSWIDKWLPDMALYVHNQWQQNTDDHINSLTGRKRGQEENLLQHWRYGASTLCGMRLDPESFEMSFFILGDSTLYIVDQAGLGSLTTAPRIDSDPRSPIDFSTSTHALLSDKRYAGEWLIGRHTVSAGYIALMTDGLAKWFQEQYLAGNRPEEILWSIKNDDEFRIFAERCRADGDLDDDLALIIMQLPDNPCIGFTDIKEYPNEPEPDLPDEPVEPEPAPTSEPEPDEPAEPTELTETDLPDEPVEPEPAEPDPAPTTEPDEPAEPTEFPETDLPEEHTKPEKHEVLNYIINLINKIK